MTRFISAPTTWIVLSVLTTSCAPSPGFGVEGQAQGQSLSKSPTRNAASTPTSRSQGVSPAQASPRPAPRARKISILPSNPFRPQPTAPDRTRVANQPSPRTLPSSPATLPGWVLASPTPVVSKPENTESVTGAPGHDQNEDDPEFDLPEGVDVPPPAEVRGFRASEVLGSRATVRWNQIREEMVLVDCGHGDFRFTPCYDRARGRSAIAMSAAFHRELLPNLHACITELITEGLGLTMPPGEPIRLTHLGITVPRSARGSTRRSLHQFGRAIDISEVKVGNIHLRYIRDRVAADKKRRDRFWYGIRTCMRGKGAFTSLDDRTDRNHRDHIHVSLRYPPGTARSNNISSGQ